MLLFMLKLCLLCYSRQWLVLARTGSVLDRFSCCHNAYLQHNWLLNELLLSVKTSWKMCSGAWQLSSEMSCHQLKVAPLNKIWATQVECLLGKLFGGLVVFARTCSRPSHIFTTSIAFLSIILLAFGRYGLEMLQWIMKIVTVTEHGLTKSRGLRNSPKIVPSVWHDLQRAFYQRRSWCYSSVGWIPVPVPIC